MSKQHANEHVRNMWLRYKNGEMSADFKPFFREMYRDRFTDVPAKPMSEWLKIQRANWVACFPLAPRTRAWGKL